MAHIKQVHNKFFVIFFTGLFTMGVFVFILATVKGNLLIFAAPMCFWASVISLPKSTKNSERKKLTVKRRRERVVKPDTSELKWRICLAGIVWVVAGTILWGRIRQPGFTDTDIVLVQRESDKSTSQLRDCLAFGKEVFLGITKL